MAGIPDTNSPPSIRRWQTAMAGISLAILSWTVLLPTALLLLGCWMILLAVAGFWALHEIDAAQGLVLDNAAKACFFLMCIAGLVDLTVIVSNFVRRLVRRPRPVPLPYPRAPPAYPIPPFNIQAPPRTTFAGFCTKHPWIMLLGMALSICTVLLPLQASHVLALPKEILASQIVLATSMLFLFAPVLLARAYWLSMRTIWAGVRHSAFFAGIVTMASLLLSILFVLFGYALTHTAGSLSPEQTKTALASCSGSLSDCTRDLIHQATANTKPRVQAAALLPINEEVPPDFERCVAELFRPVNGLSARDEALMQLRFRINDSSAREDIVHGAILSVCLVSEKLTNLRPYFFKSVMNAATHEVRSSRRWCPLVVEAPLTPDYACIQDSVWLGAVQAEMEESAYKALCEMPADERRLIQLHIWENHSHAEIGRILGCTEETARKRYSRALASLRANFSARCQ